MCSGHAPYYLAIFPPIMLEFTFKNVLKSNSTLTVYLACVGRMVPESSLPPFFLLYLVSSIFGKTLVSGGVS